MALGRLPKSNTSTPLPPTINAITGKFLKSPYLKIFSTKFYKALKKLNRLVCGKKGPKTAFIYSNLVKVGIDIFEQILIQNGFLPFEEDKNLYQIMPDTRCYYCGKTFENHGKVNHVNEEKVNGETKKVNRETGKVNGETKKDKDSSESSDYKEYEKQTLLSENHEIVKRLIFIFFGSIFTSEALF